MGGGRDKRKKAKEKKDGPSVPHGDFKTEKATAKNEVSVHVGTSVSCSLAQPSQSSLIRERKT